LRPIWLLVCSVLAASCSGLANTGASPTPTPARTGPALVQIENSPQALPLSGPQQADIVFEYLAEGGITRMTAVYFQPAASLRIEPVRSARPVTLKIQKAYQGVIFFSGAANKVLAEIREQQIPALTEGSDGGRYFARDPARAAPHNLYTTGDRLLEGMQKYGPKISYGLPKGSTASSSPAPAVANRVEFDQTNRHHVVYNYLPSESAYSYTAETGPLVDVITGQAIRVTNVVLLQVAHHDAGFTDVLGNPAVDFDLAGTGKADVFSAGHRYPASWDLSVPNKPLRILGADGKPLPMPAGLTWIHLVDPGTAS
jgi:hypothetical protein